ncbi:hypothetical protein GCM10009530_17760 [Microbispora corallina]|uniref:Uncharacterized protein n=1 Tax=Microbispora corallina TaxID=83302 RepID=A0ABQ4FY82_9ACTN|nr:hypothetical protein Mco01_27350 [Microbispora corallina]
MAPPPLTHGHTPTVIVCTCTAAGASHFATASSESRFRTKETSAVTPEPKYSDEHIATGSESSPVGWMADVAIRANPSTDHAISQMAATRITDRHTPGAARA